MAIATVLALLVLLVAGPATVYGVQHIVGDSAGWSPSASYDTWATAQTFTVGDTLVFNYDSSHKVDVVNQADYSSCSSSNSLKSYAGGSTTVTLSQAGPVYFICPTPGHCLNGMKLAVNVVAAGTPSSGTPPTTPTTPTTPSTTPATTPTTTDSPPPPPPPPHYNEAPSTLNMNMLIGLPLVLAALLAFMG